LRNGELKLSTKEQKEKGMALRGRTPNKKEIAHMSKVADLGCIVCRNNGFITPAEIHHTEGKTQKNAHLKVLPLCFYHHRMGGDKNPISRHPHKKLFEEAYGTEKELLEQVDKLLEKENLYDDFDNLPF